jgi:hypothetical protein
LGPFGGHGLDSKQEAKVKEQGSCVGLMASQLVFGQRTVRIAAILTFDTLEKNKGGPHRQNSLKSFTNFFIGKDKCTKYQIRTLLFHI